MNRLSDVGSIPTRSTIQQTDQFTGNAGNPWILLGFRHFFFYAVIAVKMLKMLYFVIFTVLLSFY